MKLFEEVVKGQQPKEVEEAWLKDTLGIEAAQEGSLTGGARDKADLKIALNWTAGNNQHGTPSRHVVYFSKFRFGDCGSKAANGDFGTA